MNLDVYTHIAKRVAELGHRDFHIQPLRVVMNPSQQEYRLHAFNQLLLPLSELPDGMEIQSDTGYLKAGAISTEIYQFYEFTGTVIIRPQTPDNYTIDFLRITLL